MEQNAEQKKPNEEIKLTVLDVLKSDNFEQHLTRQLNMIKNNIEQARSKCDKKKGERLKSNPILRLEKLGLLELQPFADAYLSIIDKVHVDLPSTLRQTIKDIGNDAFNRAAAELIKQKAKEAAENKAKGDE